MPLGPIVRWQLVEKRDDVECVARGEVLKGERDAGAEIDSASHARDVDDDGCVDRADVQTRRPVQVENLPDILAQERRFLGDEDEQQWCRSASMEGGGDCLKRADIAVMGHRRRRSGSVAPLRRRSRVQRRPGPSWKPDVRVVVRSLRRQCSIPTPAHERGGAYERKRFRRTGRREWTYRYRHRPRPARESALLSLPRPRLGRERRVRVLGRATGHEVSPDYRNAGLTTGFLFGTVSIGSKCSGTQVGWLASARRR